MNINGIWKVKKLAIEDRVMTIDEIMEQMPDTPFGMAFKEVAQQAASMVMVIGDGVAKMGICVPEDQREMALAEGAPMDENGCIFEGEVPLTEENGAYFMEEDGEKTPLELIDGYLVMPGGMYYGKD